MREDVVTPIRRAAPTTGGVADDAGSVAVAHARALRDLLAAVAAPEPLAALRRAVSDVAAALPGIDVLVYRCGADAADAVEAIAFAWGRDPELVRADDEERALAARAVGAVGPVHRRTDGCEVPDAIGLPARWSGEPVGAVVAVGSSFSAGDLRVLLGLADAAAVLIGRARHEALAVGERDRAEALEAEVARAVEMAVVREPLARAGQLAAAVAHEMSGPLACLAANLRTLSQGVGEGAGARGPADLAAAAHDGLADLERLRDLVRCFRELARPGGGRAVYFDPAEAISDALRLFTASRPGCAVFVDAPRTLPTVHGPPSSVAHVLLNLLDNGADAGGDRGPLRLAVSVERGELLLRVRDAGPGIAPEIAARIFDPWFTTKAPARGTGLGLWLCREIAEGLGGRIGVESGPDGTTFEVALPIASTDPEAWR